MRNKLAFTDRQADREVAFDLSHHGHALVTLYVQFLCSDWSKFERWVHAWKIYGTSWNFFWLLKLTEFCVTWLCFLFPLDVQNEIQLLTRFLCYSWLVCSLVFWLRNEPVVKVIGNPISDGSVLLTSLCLMFIIKRVQKSLKRFWWPSGASWLVSLSYYCIWCGFFFLVS